VYGGCQTLEVRQSRVVVTRLDRRPVCRMMGLKDSQIVQHGLPIRPAFSKRPAATWLLRRRLGLHATLPAVLMVGGGEGMGKLEATVRAIGKKGTRCQIAVICGRNDKLKAKLETGDWGPSIEVHTFGFVSNMHEFMAACDAIITKAGAPLRCSLRTFYGSGVAGPQTRFAGGIRAWNTGPKNEKCWTCSRHHTSSTIAHGCSKQTSCLDTCRFVGSIYESIAEFADHCWYPDWVVRLQVQARLPRP
jgi:hypothetical protein